MMNNSAWIQVGGTGGEKMRDSDSAKAREEQPTQQLIQPVPQNQWILPQTCSPLFHVCILSLQLDCYFIQSIDTKHLPCVWHWPTNVFTRREGI